MDSENEYHNKIKQHLDEVREYYNKIEKIKEHMILRVDVARSSLVNFLITLTLGTASIFILNFFTKGEKANASDTFHSILVTFPLLISIIFLFMAKYLILHESRKHYFVFVDYINGKRKNCNFSDLSSSILLVFSSISYATAFLIGSYFYLDNCLLRAVLIGLSFIFLFMVIYLEIMHFVKRSRENTNSELHPVTGGPTRT